MKFTAVVGTGGLGSGMFLALEGNRTLGREESRAAVRLDQQDRCKLHIVCHYLRRLLSPAVPVVPIGRVGNDAAGRMVVDELAALGLSTSYVSVSPEPTLFSVCFRYPNGDGGNITTTGSASDRVAPADIEAAAAVFAAHRGEGIAIALPEVPLAARVALLELATEYGFLRVATLVAGEADRSDPLLDKVDLLAVNRDEAAALAGVDPEATPVEEVVAAAVRRLGTLPVVVTAGRYGSWVFDGTRTTHTPAPPVDVVNTAGAGDAHLAGLVSALAHGKSLSAANRYAATVSALSVTSRHTIHPDLGPETVRAAGAESLVP